MDESDEQSDSYEEHPHVVEMPSWLENLQDTEVHTGGILTYQLGEHVDLYGDNMTVTVDFGEADEFSTYDPIHNVIQIDPSLMSYSETGEYRITVYATTMNANYAVKDFGNVFTVTVTKDDS